MPGTARLWRRPPARWQAPAAQRSNQAQRTLVMTTFGSRADGLRLERMRASPRWAGDGFRNRHPIAPGLRDSALVMPSTVDFLCAGQRRVGAHLQGWGLPAGRLTGLDGWESCCLSGANGGGLTVGPAHALEAHAPLGGGAFLPVYWALSAWRCMPG